MRNPIDLISILNPIILHHNPNWNRLKSDWPIHSNISNRFSWIIIWIFNLIILHHDLAYNSLKSCFQGISWYKSTSIWIITIFAYVSEHRVISYLEAWQGCQRLLYYWTHYLSTWGFWKKDREVRRTVKNWRKTCFLFIGIKID